MKDWALFSELPNDKWISNTCLRFFKNIGVVNKLQRGIPRWSGDKLHDKTGISHSENARQAAVRQKRNSRNIVEFSSVKFPSPRSDSGCWTATTWPYSPTLCLPKQEVMVESQWWRQCHGTAAAADGAAWKSFQKNLSEIRSRCMIIDYVFILATYWNDVFV